MKGGCLCGGIAYEIRGPIIGINYCHCTQCRKASGTAFGTSAAVSRDDLVIVCGETLLSSYQSSPGKRRVFCGNCGSPLYSEREGATVRYVRLGTLDDDPGRRADVHIHVASGAPWYDICDDVPQLEDDQGLWF